LERRNLKMAPQIANVTFRKNSSPKSQSVKRKLKPKERKNPNRFAILALKIQIAMVRTEGEDISKTSEI
jgi:hypothetical protein